MKKNIAKIVAMLLIAASFSFSASAQYVRIRPNAPVYERPVAPSPRHIWVEGEWGWRGGTYVYTNGYWAAPRPGWIWIPGHWKERRRGWFWVPGHWRRG